MLVAAAVVGVVVVGAVVVGAVVVGAVVVGAAVVGVVVGLVVGLVVGDAVLVGVDVAVAVAEVDREVVGCCVNELDAADVEGAAFVGVWLADTDGVGELLAEADDCCVAFPASESLAPAPPFPPPGLCDVSRIAATATITTAAATGMIQRH